MTKDGELDPLTFLYTVRNFLSDETNLYIINKTIRLTIYALRNLMPNIEQTNPRSVLFKYLFANLWNKCEALQKNMINYMMDLINPSDIIQFKELSSKIGFYNVVNVSESSIDDDMIQDSFQLSEIGFDDRTKIRLAEMLYQSPFVTAIQKDRQITILLSDVEGNVYENIKECYFNPKTDNV
jgi:hypothetical protein